MDIKNLRITPDGMEKKRAPHLYLLYNRVGVVVPRPKTMPNR